MTDALLAQMPTSGRRTHTTQSTFLIPNSEHCNTFSAASVRAAVFYVFARAQAGGRRGGSRAREWPDGAFERYRLAFSEHRRSYFTDALRRPA